MLRAEGVHWHFDDAGTPRPILRGLDVEFEAGGTYAVTGPSGCGKTTLLSILSLLCRPQRGRVVFRGADVSSLPDAEAQRFRRQHVGLVFQSFRLIETLTVAEQILFAADIRGRPDSARAGRAMIERFGLGSALDRLPVHLSGGEKQRVAVAQALMFGPSVVLADEPTAALDEANTTMIAQELCDYAHESGSVVITVSHDAALVGRFDAELRLAEHSLGGPGGQDIRASDQSRSAANYPSVTTWNETLTRPAAASPPRPDP